MNLMTVDGKANVLKRTKKDKSVQFSFMIKPEFTENDKKILTAQIPGLRSQQQLKPVIAKRFGIQVPAYNVTLLSDETATNFDYINQEQLLRFNVPEDEAFDLADDLEVLRPGLPAKIFMAYDAEKTSAYATVKLTIDDVKKALGIRAGAEYKFIEPEIRSRVADFISNRSLDIKVKGEVPHIADIVSAVTSACFAKTSEQYLDDDLDGKPRRRRVIRDDSGDDDTDFDRTRHRRRNPDFPDDDIPPADGSSTSDQPGSSTSPNSSSMQSLADDLKFYRSKPVKNSSSIPRGGQFQSNGVNDLLVWLRFAPEKETCKGQIYYNHEAVADSKEIAIYNTFLTTHQAPPGEKPQTVTKLGTKVFRVESSTSTAKPYQTGIFVGPNDRWTLNSAFEFYGIINYGFSTPKKERYRWESEWASPDSDLYYRIGDGPWTPVNGRTVADSIDEGELQFYVDRAKLWSKLPLEKYRKGTLGGIGAPLFYYKNFFPEFVVTVTGKQIK